MAASTSVIRTLDDLHENLQLVIEQLNDGVNTRDVDGALDMDGFWNRLGLTFKAVSAETTKLTIAFSTPPLPDKEEAQPLISGIEKSTLSMLSCFYSLPTEKGKTLHKQIHRAVASVLSSVQALVLVIKNEGSEGSKRQLQSTGGVWEHCDKFPKLPRTNRDAVLISARQNIELVKDALEEISTAVEETPVDDISHSPGDNDIWSEEDRKLLAPSLGLIKTARSCIKKVTVALRDHGLCDSDLHISELDDLCGLLNQASPAVDDFVLSLYPPVRKDAVREESQNLADALLSLLNQSKAMHVTLEIDNQWLEFLTKAVHHNLNKLQQFLPT